LNSSCIVDGHAKEAVGTVRELFLEYAAWLTVDLCFQDIEAELAALPGKCAPPTGAILLAQVGSTVAGCVAMRRLEAAVGEMKPLWVRQSFRNCGIGKMLIEAIIERALIAVLLRQLLISLRGHFGHFSNKCDSVPDCRVVQGHGPGRHGTHLDAMFYNPERALRLLLFFLRKTRRVRIESSTNLGLGHPWC
jgi:GNAT superfamily N-acetyltransferase